MKNGVRDYHFFDQWARRNGMSPIQRITDVKVDGVPVGDILLADSGSLINSVQYPPMEGQEHRMFSFYRTGFAIDRPGQKTWFAFYNDYPSDSFAEYTSAEGRQGKRLEEAIQYAVKAIEQTQGVGLYERRSQVH